MSNDEQRLHSGESIPSGSEVAQPGHDPAIHPLAAVLRRYAFGYTAMHDFSVSSQIMVPNYVLRMGPDVLEGRDGAYKAATLHQFDQYPGLGFTVHDLVLGTDRAALRFSEHGRSSRFGTAAVWQGISLYRWDGSRLTECRVEQDYFSRQRQLTQRRPNSIEAPAADPWTAAPEAPDLASESIVRSWLSGGGLQNARFGSMDDERSSPSARPRIDQSAIEILDLFSAGSRVVFHIMIRGRYGGGLEGAVGKAGDSASLYSSGIARVREGRVSEVNAISDRLGLMKRLQNQQSQSNHGGS